MLFHCHECMMSFILCIQLGTSPKPAAACLLTCQFFLLHVRFRNTSRLLHPKMIHIVPRQVLVRIYAYITNICRLCKKLHQQMKIHFPYIFVFRGGLGRTTVLGTAAFIVVNFAAFVERALLPTRRGRIRTVCGLPHPANILYIHDFKHIIRDMTERYEWHPHLSD